MDNGQTKYSPSWEPTKHLPNRLFGATRSFFISVICRRFLGTKFAAAFSIGRHSTAISTICSVGVSIPMSTLVNAIGIRKYRTSGHVSPRRMNIVTEFA